MLIGAILHIMSISVTVHGSAAQSAPFAGNNNLIHELNGGINYMKMLVIGIVLFILNVIVMIVAAVLTGMGIYRIVTRKKFMPRA